MWAFERRSIGVFVKAIGLVVLLWHGDLAWSQSRPATIKFTDDSTLEGYGEIKDDVIYFSLTEQDKPDMWTYEDAKSLIFSGYGFKEQFDFVPLKDGGTPHLVQLIDQGRANLYLDVYFLDVPISGATAEMVSDIFAPDGIVKNYYVKRENESFAQNINTSFKSRAKKYFADCPIIVEKIDAGKFKSSNIPDMVGYYNDYCDGEE